MTTDTLMTGAEYLDSLRDGRAVYVDGDRVEDVTTHPAFRNAARPVARLYNALHDPATSEVPTGVDPDTDIRTYAPIASSNPAPPPPASPGPEKRSPPGPA
ncbi:4-hydroxyphenylacetate 3-hydroxylase N-terminal domain-containing protein [Streptomyces sp. NPDC057575]|uniref:4-hydroxyphenylacetate 3-hydroxylase N-terminal domain-containing protein n=1 Tax=unclassified Streptomyces TaxID=2593676 RepID=UPI0036A27936